MWCRLGSVTGSRVKLRPRCSSFIRISRLSNRQLQFRAQRARTWLRTTRPTSAAFRAAVRGFSQEQQPFHTEEHANEPFPKSKSPRLNAMRTSPLPELPPPWHTSFANALYRQTRELVGRRKDGEFNPEEAYTFKHIPTLIWIYLTLAFVLWCICLWRQRANSAKFSTSVRGYFSAHLAHDEAQENGFLVNHEDVYYPMMNTVRWVDTRKLVNRSFIDAAEFLEKACAVLIGTMLFSPMPLKVVLSPVLVGMCGTSFLYSSYARVPPYIEGRKIRMEGFQDWRARKAQRYATGQAIAGCLLGESLALLVGSHGYRVPKLMRTSSVVASAVVYFLGHALENKYPDVCQFIYETPEYEPSDWPVVLFRATPISKDLPNLM